MIAPIVPELSIIIPAYNEERRLPRGLTKIRDYLASRDLAHTQVEIIVVLAQQAFQVLFGYIHPKLLRFFKQGIENCSLI